MDQLNPRNDTKINESYKKAMKRHNKFFSNAISWYQKNRGHLETWELIENIKNKFPQLNDEEIKDVIGIL